MFLQALQAFSKIIRAVEALRGTKEDMVRVRMFITRDEDSGKVGRALKEVFVELTHLSPTLTFPKKK
jgi:enamine deaminase RidA (YjgF/YER057c/UK114 family)